MRSTRRTHLLAERVCRKSAFIIPLTIRWSSLPKKQPTRILLSVSLGTSFFSDIFEEVASVAVDHVVQ